MEKHLSNGFLPAPLAAVHGRFHTPHIAIVVQTILVIALAASGSFEKLVVISNGSVLLVYAACCLSVINLRRMKVRGEGEPFRMPLARIVPILAFLVIVWILSTLSADEWKSLLVIAAVAVVIFAASMPNRRAQQSARAEGVA